MSQLRVMHFMNQFFAGIGGEEKADTPVGLFEGQVGAGKRLQELLGKSAEIVVTAYCGDDYFAGHSQEAIDCVKKIAQDYKVSLIVAGPAFSSGRYGFSCAQICHAMTDLPGLVCVTAMHPENPGLESYRQYKDDNVYAIPAAKSAAGMGEALSKVAQFTLKIASNSEIGPSAQEGYIPRGVRKDAWIAKDGAERAVDMLLAKIAARPFMTEIPGESPETVPVAPAIGGLAKARIALATSSGVILKGNPDNFKAHKNVQWRKYSIKNLDTMKNTDWDVLHSGYNNIFMKDNPNFGIPLDVSRLMEKEGVFANLYPYFYTTSGCNASVPVMQRLGREMVSDMKAERIDGVIMVSTWGTDNRSGATITKEIERGGIPVALITALPMVAIQLGASRVVTGTKIPNPCGDVNLPPENDRELRREIVKCALEALQTNLSSARTFVPKVSFTSG